MYPIAVSDPHAAFAPPAPPPPAGGGFGPPPPAGGVFGVVRTYRRQLPTFLAVALAIFLAVAAYTFAQTPRYTAGASVVVAPRRSEIGSDRAQPMSDPTGDSSVDTQVEVITSRAMAEAVVDALGLARPAPFARLIGPPSLRQRAGLEPPGPPLAAAARRVAAIDRVQGGLAVRRVAQTFVLDIAFTGPDPQLAAAIANAFAVAYVRESLDLKLQGARDAGRLLGPQLAAARAESEAAQAAVGRYRIANSLLDTAGGTLAEQQLGSFEQQVANARAGEAEAQARLATARQQLARGSNGEDVGEALGSPVIQELRRQRAEVSRRLAELTARYGSRHPDIMVARDQLSDFDGQIGAEVRRVISSVEAQAQIASRRTESLQSSLDRAQGAVAGNNAAGVRLSALQSRADSARLAYEQLLARVRDIGTQAATTQADARVAGVAVAPARPTAPNVPINLLVGLLAGMAGGIGAVLLRQGLDQGIGTLEDVEGRLALRYLAGLPTIRSALGRGGGKDPVRALMAHRASAFAEGYRALAASILQGADRPVKAIAITSALPGEGKTATAICLARTLAFSGRRVVLVDGDLRRPRIAHAMRLQPDFGLQAVIAGEVPLDRALLQDETGLWVLPLAGPDSFASSPIEDGRIDTILEALKARFDIVVIDAGPVLPVVDGRLLARRADAVVLLARWRRTPVSAVELASHLLAQVGVDVAGVALTYVDLQAQARNGYGDPAKFLRSYQNYYA